MEMTGVWFTDQSFFVVFVFHFILILFSNLIAFCLLIVVLFHLNNHCQIDECKMLISKG